GFFLTFSPESRFEIPSALGSLYLAGAPSGNPHSDFRLLRDILPVLGFFVEQASSLAPAQARTLVLRKNSQTGRINDPLGRGRKTGMSLPLLFRRQGQSSTDVAGRGVCASDRPASAARFRRHGRGSPRR